MEELHVQINNWKRVDDYKLTRMIQIALLALNNARCNCYYDQKNEFRYEFKEQGVELYITWK